MSVNATLNTVYVIHLSSCSVVVPNIETEKHATMYMCAVETNKMWLIRKHMTQQYARLNFFFTRRKQLNSQKKN